MSKHPKPAESGIKPREFRSADEIDRGITKLNRRIKELNALDLPAAISTDNASDDVAISNVRHTLMEVFGQSSPEFQQYQFIDLWAGPIRIGMQLHERIAAVERGRTHVVGILNGLIGRLQETREDLDGGVEPTPTSYFDKLKLHPRIGDVAREQFMDGYHWEAVFAASKALVNYVKEKSGSDLDGAKLMTTVFSKNKPILAFNELADQTDLDEQEGMMHLFLGAVLAIRNRGGHSFPEGSDSAQSSTSRF